MFDDLKAYFVENILVLYKHYLNVRRSQNLASSNDLRAAINLSIALYHLREHMPLTLRKKRDEYTKLCNDYSLIGDIVNASKHGTLTQGTPQIKDARNIYEIVVSTEYKDAKGEYYHVQKCVFVKLDKGIERDLHEIIINVLNMWISELNTSKILTNYPLQNINSKRIPRRTKKSGILNLHAIQNLRFGPKFKLQKYNYEKKQIEPVDLTGASITMNIYKPLYKICMSAQKDDKKFNLEIEVDENQIKEYKNLKTNEDRIKYFFDHAKEQGITDWNAAKNGFSESVANE